ncbi:hypothetical protein AURDEDRAFT_176113 [Auricularia subglabra TFB-10046 SS5]|uniref:Uncharacterized protein n=1 Tax=Auricularia subglabra (strain TFB-10046 / SS5) TaxID=717982 RepID=J0LDT0_AURST|nr:hypothetical protein AURDEDRAFT_176113 [Auricularia subglabra TFB-10046 SS5]
MSQAAPSSTTLHRRRPRAACLRFQIAQQRRRAGSAGRAREVHERLTKPWYAALGVHALKAVLADNHVNVQHLLEKGKLVAKVHLLLEEELRKRARAGKSGEASTGAEGTDAPASADAGGKKPKPALPPERQSVL